MENPVNTMPPAPTPVSKKPVGSMIAIIIIIVLFALGGLYFWGKELMTNSSKNQPLPATSSSDEVRSIENDASVEVNIDDSIDLGELEATLK